MKKINSLILNWKNGTIKLTSALVKENISYALIMNYKNNKWIEKIGNGAYKLYRDDVDFFSAINALQEQLDSFVHIGGKSALELMGYSHFAQQSLNQIFLFGKLNDRLPTWLKNYKWERKYFFNAMNLFSIEPDNCFTEYKHNLMSVKISSPELAVLEMLYHVPSKIGFNDASLILDNLRTLRSEEMQILLENCNSVKVKRLFLFLAEEQDLPVFENLKLDKINLGSGKRVIVNDGRLNSKYQITVLKDSYYEK